MPAVPWAVPEICLGSPHPLPPPSLRPGPTCLSKNGGVEGAPAHAAHRGDQGDVEWPGEGYDSI